ncbi:MAG: fatty acid desaturase [Pseudohongiellaceae bacterium]
MRKTPINWTNMLLFSMTPLAAVILVPLYGYYVGYDVFEWAMFLLLLAFCGLSITAGYHRLWSHKTYKAHWSLRILFALGGACALQNDVIHWASDHRRHHRHVDNNDHDPYSAGRGFWFSHIGWILRNYPSAKIDFSNVKDLYHDPVVIWQQRNYLALVLTMNIGLPLLLGLLHGDVIASLLLAGLLRLVVSQHFTYLINSLAHMWGHQPYSSTSSARDNFVLALLTWGEGYHNYHHTFQWDYRNGIHWWHWDPTKWLISSFALFGLTTELKRCAPADIESARLEMQYRKATETCNFLQLPESWQQLVENEYQQFRETLKLWATHRQQWYEVKSRNLQEALGHWDRVQLRDSYREIHYKLKIQRRRWQDLLSNLRNPQLVAV